MMLISRFMRVFGRGLVLGGFGVGLLFGAVSEAQADADGRLDVVLMTCKTFR